MGPRHRDAMFGTGWQSIGLTTTLGVEHLLPLRVAVLDMSLLAKFTTCDAPCTVNGWVFTSKVIPCAPPSIGQGHYKLQLYSRRIGVRESVRRHHPLGVMRTSNWRAVLAFRLVYTPTLTEMVQAFLACRMFPRRRPPLYDGDQSCTSTHNSWWSMPRCAM